MKVALARPVESIIEVLETLGVDVPPQPEGIGNTRKKYFYVSNDPKEVAQVTVFHFCIEYIALDYVYTLFN